MRRTEAVADDIIRARRRYLSHPCIVKLIPAGASKHSAGVESMLAAAIGLRICTDGARGSLRALSKRAARVEAAMSLLAVC